MREAHTALSARKPQAVQRGTMRICLSWRSCHERTQWAVKKRPDGLTLVPWQKDKPLAWDVTVICPFADSYVDLAARTAGAAAELAADRKTTKYYGLETQCLFEPVAVESLGPLNESAYHFLSVLGLRIAEKSGDDRESSFLFQRISVLVQRFNSILLHDSFVYADHLD
jgi:hypothetical protein